MPRCLNLKFYPDNFAISPDFSSGHSGAPLGSIAPRSLTDP